jgi:NADP-dependent 3-hydroxy acid dehydrogenase YdfG
MSKLQGKIAVITGGNSGIGLATEIAGPKTSATAVENFASSGNREHADVFSGETILPCTKPLTHA